MLRIMLAAALAAFAGGASAQEPPRADAFDNPTQFLACTGNPYALCYYSGPNAPTPTRGGEPNKAGCMISRPRPARPRPMLAA